MRAIETITWDEESGDICLIDQTRLPNSYHIIRCSSVDRLIRAIGRLEIRGAPALGVAGAYGIALAARRIREREHAQFMRMLHEEAGRISAARPTAVNLSFGVRTVMDEVEKANSVTEARSFALSAARRVADVDARSCHSLGSHGASLFPDSCTVLTHCNAGALACSEWGTALGVIRSAVIMGKDVRVVACETRPLFQGARLTAWELDRDGIPVTVITDSEAAFLMKNDEIDLVIVGADRITPDAVFNKVGTYMHAVCAAYHQIPFNVAAPLSTFDPDHTAADITIEERGREEIAVMGKVNIVPETVPVRNPAFDATPHSLVGAFITEKGILRPPLDWEYLAKERKVKTGNHNIGSINHGV